MAKRIFSNSKFHILYGLAGIIFLLSMFCLYSAYRQRYVGASDVYGYYSEALLLKSGRVYMETSFNPRKYTCTAPLGYFVRDGKVVPKYPPGYPFLMALAGFFNLEFYVNPLVGVLTILVMFLLLLKVTDRTIASLFSVLWAFSPIVFWGSTSVMSDLSATLFILLTFYFFIQEKPGASGICMGFSLVIRPSNLLFLVVLAPLLIKKRQWLRFGLHFLIPALLYGIFNWVAYGAPWRSGYRNLFYELSPPVFFSHLLFYLKEITVQFTPVLVILALAALWKRTRDSSFYGFWILIFLLFYCFWKSGGDAWWWTRFLLPAFPALFILAALGLKMIMDFIHGKRKIPHKYSTSLLILVTIIMAIYFVHFGVNQGLYRTNRAHEYYDLTRQVAEFVPPNSLVGSYELSGAFRLYTDLECFNWHSGDAPLLIRNQLKKRIPIFLVVEAWNWEHVYVKNILNKFRYEIINNIDSKGNCLVLKDKWLIRIIRYKRFRKRKI